MINTNIVAPSTTIDIQAPDEMLFNDVFLPEDAHEDLNEDERQENEDDGPIDIDGEDDCGSNMSSIHTDDGEPDMDDASFAAHSCNSSGSTPITTSRSTPTTTYRSTPTTTSRSTLLNKTNTSQLASNTIEKFETPVTN